MCTVITFIATRQGPMLFKLQYSFSPRTNTEVISVNALLKCNNYNLGLLYICTEISFIQIMIMCDLCLSMLMHRNTNTYTQKQFKHSSNDRNPKQIYQYQQKQSHKEHFLFQKNPVLLTQTSTFKLPESMEYTKQI